MSVWTGPDTPVITNEMAHDLALAQKVCVRPMVRRVLDRETGTEDLVPIPCGSTREAVCPSCAYKARVLRMQQCAEGWHRTTEPDQSDHNPADPEDQDQDDLDTKDDHGRRFRSTRRRQDVPDLPRVPVRVSSGAPSTRPPRPAGRLWTAFRQLTGHRDPQTPAGGMTTPRPHPIPARTWSKERQSTVSAANPKDTSAASAVDGRDGDQTIRAG